MAGRPRIGSRVVILLAVASTLLATWLPPPRACACGSATTAAVQAGTEADAAPVGSCSCCCDRPADAADIRPCCRADQNATQSGANGACDCSSPAGPGAPEPAIPPRPSDADEAGSPTAADAVAAPDCPRPPITTPAILAARGRAGPPPVDLIISLSRLTC